MDDFQADLSADYISPTDAWGGDEAAAAPAPDMGAELAAAQQPEEDAELLEAEEGEEQETDEEPDAPEADELGDKEVEVTVDGKKETRKVAELVKDYELRKASHERMEKSSELMKMALSKWEEAQTTAKQYQEKETSLREALDSVFGSRGGPDAQLEFMQAQGIDLWGLMERHIAVNGMDIEDVARRLGSIQVMTPTQRQMLHEQRQLESLREQRKRDEAMIESQRAEFLAQSATKQLEASVDTALVDVGLPVNPEMRVEVVRFLAKFLPPTVNGEQPLVTDALVKAAAREIADSLPKRVSSVLGDLEGEALIERLGPDMVKRIQKELVKRAKKGVTSAKAPVKSPGAGKSTPKRYFLDELEF